MPEIGLIITADDKAGRVLEAVGKTGKASLEGVRSAAGKVGTAFKAMGVGFAIFNQTLELGKKALEFFRLAITDTINTALNFRRIGDPAIEAFKNMERNAQIFRARLGDILIPLAQGLMDAFNDTGNAVLDWINANRKLIATNIADYMRDIATIAVKGVAWGVLQIARAWQGWILLVDTVKISVNTAFSGMLSGINKVLLALHDVALAAGETGLAAKIETAGRAVEALGAQFQESADNSKASLQEEISILDEVETKIKGGVAFALRFVGESHAAMMARIERSVIGGIRTNEEYEESLKRIGDIAKRVFGEQARLLQRIADLRERDARLIDRQIEDRKTKLLEQTAIYTDAIGSMVQSTGAILADFDETATNKLKALGASLVETAGQIVSETAKKVILANAAEGASAAGAQAMSIPGIGIAIAPAVAAAAFGVIAALVSKIPAFETGGMVGSAGLADLHAGERVVDADRTRKLNRWIDGLGSLPQGGRAPANVTIQADIKVQNPDEMSEEQIKRWWLRIAKQGEGLVDDGLLFRNLQRA